MGIGDCHSTGGLWDEWVPSSIEFIVIVRILPHYISCNVLICMSF